MENNIKCKKCGCFGTSANGLCKSCYSKFWYARKVYNTSLKDFITNGKHYHKAKSEIEKANKRYAKFKATYEAKNYSTITELSKKVGLSRETIYKYIKKYRSEI